jgi:hypothetical protein
MHLCQSYSFLFPRSQPFLMALRKMEEQGNGDWNTDEQSSKAPDETT